MNIAASAITLLPKQLGYLTCPQTWEVRESKSCLFHRFKYIYGGEAYYESETTKPVPLKHGHLYLFPSNRPYHLFHNKADPVRILWFHIVANPDVTNELVAYKVVKDSIAFHFVKILEQMTQSQERPYDTFAALIKALLIEMSKQAKFEYVSDERVLKALNIIHDSYAADLSLEKLADGIGINKFYFIRMFRDIMGLTPMQYLLKYRLQCAKEMLAQDIPVNVVAKNVGFSDEKFFSKIFKKYLLLSPRDYKRQKIATP
ncbi:MAG: helix-turn-helix transcriptional regulator [Spirochaetes bacterium]|nr:helix-turn-helix transcriptional regulator [Spirochaetota bacterium]